MPDYSLLGNYITDITVMADFFFSRRFLIQANVHYIHLWSKHIGYFLVTMLMIILKMWWRRTIQKINTMERWSLYHNRVNFPKCNLFKSIYLCNFFFLHAVLFIVCNFIKIVPKNTEPIYIGFYINCQHAFSLNLF